MKLAGVGVGEEEVGRDRYPVGRVKQIWISYVKSVFVRSCLSLWRRRGGEEKMRCSLLMARCLSLPLPSRKVLELGTYRLPPTGTTYYCQQVQGPLKGSDSLPPDFLYLRPTLLDSRPRDDPTRPRGERELTTITTTTTTTMPAAYK